MRELPKGLGIEEIKVHRCADGGLLYEFYREEGFGQLAVRTVLPGETAGGHFHEMEEFWLIFKGEAVVRLEFPDKTRWLKHYSGKNPKIIPLPSGTGHEIKNVGEDDVAFIFWAEELYDPEDHSKIPWKW